jgi:hypothetical protein
MTILVPHRFRLICISLILLGGCSRGGSSLATPFPVTSTAPAASGLSGAEAATLNSVEKLDEYPLYTMTYVGRYSPGAASLRQVHSSIETRSVLNPYACPAGWGCSLFAALGDDGSRLYGRNFDWQYSPAVLLFTDPPEGYASVSMVDITYLGFDSERARNLADLPLGDRRNLLDAPFLPFDGMNEKGLAVGMAAVPPGGMQPDPQKATVDQLRVIREILDHAATVDEAVALFGRYNIDMGTVPIHYLVASAAGESALVEFYQGKMVVFRNEVPWQQATNFLVASTDGDPAGACPRYDLINERLGRTEGRITTQEALGLLNDVSQGTTQWSVIYNMTGGSVDIVMGRDYRTVHTLHLDQAGE